jgi:hypothetical protein
MRVKDLKRKERERESGEREEKKGERERGETYERIQERDVE